MIQFSQKVQFYEMDATYIKYIRELRKINY